MKFIGWVVAVVVAMMGVVMLALATSNPNEQARAHAMAECKSTVRVGDLKIEKYGPGERYDCMRRAALIGREPDDGKRHINGDPCSEIVRGENGAWRFALDEVARAKCLAGEKARPTPLN